MVAGAHRPKMMLPLCSTLPFGDRAKELVSPTALGEPRILANLACKVLILALDAIRSEIPQRNFASRHQQTPNRWVSHASSHHRHWTSRGREWVLNRVVRETKSGSETSFDLEVHVSL
jgi:hypothetical protein